jgi:hypothetical protein
MVGGPGWDWVDGHARGSGCGLSQEETEPSKQEGGAHKIARFARPESPKPTPVVPCKMEALPCARRAPPCSLDFHLPKCKALEPVARAFAERGARPLIQQRQQRCAGGVRQWLGRAADGVGGEVGQAAAGDKQDTVGVVILAPAGGRWGRDAAGASSVRGWRPCMWRATSNQLHAVIKTPRLA